MDLNRGPHLNAARAEQSAAVLHDEAVSPVWAAKKLGHLAHMPRCVCCPSCHT